MDKEDKETIARRNTVVDCTSSLALPAGPVLVGPLEFFITQAPGGEPIGRTIRLSLGDGEVGIRYLECQPNPWPDQWMR